MAPFLRNVISHLTGLLDFLKCKHSDIEVLINLLNQNTVIYLSLFLKNIQEDLNNYQSIDYLR